MSSRNDAFQALKPPAVALSQATLKLVGNQIDRSIVTDRLKKLQDVVLEVSNASQLDNKLADYIFFPISQVLKISKQITLESLELCLSLVAILVKDGWKSQIEDQLAQQLLILCTISAGDQPTILASKKTSTELQRNALICVSNVYDAISSSATGSSFSQDAHIAQLGQTISTVLTLLQHSNALDVQTAAAEALRSITKQLLKSDLSSRFLPGIVSALTKTLTPSTDQRRPASILIISLDILAALFEATFRHNLEAEDLEQSRTNDLPTLERRLQKQNDSMSEAAPQIRLALNNVVRLRTHDRHDVRNSLAKLCMIIIRDCAKTLANCVQLSLETLITLCSAAPAKIRFDLSMLVTSNPTISKLLQESIHNWTQSLVRIMQSSDDNLKSRRLNQISIAYQCIADTGMDLTWCDRELGQSLVDSVVLNLQHKQLGNSPAQIESIQSVDLSMSTIESCRVLGFTELADAPGQKDILQQIASLANTVATCNESSLLIKNLVRSLPYLQGDELSANMWLLTTALRTQHEKSQDLDSMLDLTSTNPVTQSLIGEVYPAALSLLTDATETTTNSTQLSLALQLLALRAQEIGEEFRFELIDALYPVLYTMATPDDRLQQDSVAALRIITSACSYTSVTDLIVENVDYLTNAVSLKLNAFDVSPQAPQVLLMMVRLAGPALLPYLEDTIESIFAALEDYHGYPLLVELLFKTLTVVAEEGAKTPLLLAASPISVVHTGVEIWKPIMAHELASRLRERVDEEAQLKQQQIGRQEPAPHESWTSKEVNEAQQEATDDVVQQPPAPKSYALIHKITELTQHYLPSSSPSLRLSLLSLIRTTVPSIARHENTFLPLINTLWPEIVSRLEDDETIIRASAIESITCLCIYAKSFMRSRISDLWPLIEKMWKDVSKELAHTTAVTATSLLLPSASSANDSAVVSSVRAMRLGYPSSSFQSESSNTAAMSLRQALLESITAIVQYVPLDTERFDAALQMMDSKLNDAKAMDAFEQENADAVWLARLKRGLIELPVKPAFLADQTRCHLVGVNG